MTEPVLLRQIFNEGELDESATCKDLLQVKIERKRHMRLTTWKAGEVRKTDVTIAKNYLKEEEIDRLNRIVVMWLDYADDQAKRRKQVFMKDWEKKLDDFLAFNERKILPNAGSISKQEADDFAKNEYDHFAECRWEYKEAIGQEESIKQLEEVAKKLGHGSKKLENVE